MYACINQDGKAPVVTQQIKKRTISKQQRRLNKKKQQQLQGWAIPMIHCDLDLDLRVREI